MKRYQSTLPGLLVALLVLALALAACGGAAAPTSESAPEATTETADTTTDATPEPEAEPVAEGTEEAMAENESLAGSELVVYSGRSEELVGPLIEMFEKETGIDVAVNYGDTAEMAATILEEGSNSPADVYYGQDAGALGALTNAEILQELPGDVLALVNPTFRAPEGQWVGTSGRVRVVVYNTDILAEADLPASILDYTDPKWSGKIGWAPTNGSFQAFVTALRVTAGEEEARAWLEGIQANQPKVYANNLAVLEAVAAGEVEVGFINHYYLFRKLAEEGEGFPARNYFFSNGDIGGLVNVAGVGILKTTEHQEAAEAFVRFLLSPEAQAFFREETKEYPLASGVAPEESLPALDSLILPEIDLNNLQDLAGTLELLQELGIL